MDLFLTTTPPNRATKRGYEYFIVIYIKLNLERIMFAIEHLGNAPVTMGTGPCFRGSAAHGNHINEYFVAYATVDELAPEVRVDTFNIPSGRYTITYPFRSRQAIKRYNHIIINGLDSFGSFMKGYARLLLASAKVHKYGNQRAKIVKAALELK